MAQVIVVTPDVAFMHSLTFVLESGGVRVLSYGALDPAFGSTQARHVGCAVVDDEAINDWQYAQELFRSFRNPVILLVDQYCPPLDVPYARCLAKPFLGEPLIQAVQEAITGKF
jgi:FixJ family two-component response regulator